MRDSWSTECGDTEDGVEEEPNKDETVAMGPAGPDAEAEAADATGADATVLLSDGAADETAEDATTILREKPLFAEDDDAPIEDDSAGLFTLGDMEDLTEGIDVDGEWDAGSGWDGAANVVMGGTGTSTDGAADDAANGHVDRTVLMPRPQTRHAAGDTAAAPAAGSRWDPDDGTTYLYGDTSRKQDRRAERAAREAERREARRGREPRRPKHGFLSFWLWLATFAIMGLMYLRTLPLDESVGRLVPEAVAFLPAAVIPLGIVVVLAILWHRRALTLVAGAAFVLLCYWHAGFFLASGQLSAQAAAPASSDTSARVMTLNTNNGAADPAQVVAAVRDQGVEVLALQEVPSGYLDQLYAAGIGQYLPYYVAGMRTSSDNGGINVLLFAAGPSDASSNLVPTENSAMAAGTIGLGTKSLRFVSVHPNSPVRGAQDLWSSGLSSVARLSGYDHVYVLMGDFNATWDHQAFRTLLGTSFVDAGEQAGEGFHMTFPANSRVPALIEIDHIVYTAGAGVYVGDLDTVEIAGTDHEALLATIEAQ